MEEVVNIQDAFMLTYPFIKYTMASTVREKYPYDNVLSVRVRSYPNNHFKQKLDKALQNPYLELIHVDDYEKDVYTYYILVKIITTQKVPYRLKIDDATNTFVVRFRDLVAFGYGLSKDEIYTCFSKRIFSSFSTEVYVPLVKGSLVEPIPMVLFTVVNYNTMLFSLKDVTLEYILHNAYDLHTLTFYDQNQNIDNEQDLFGTLKYGSLKGMYKKLLKNIFVPIVNNDDLTLLLNKYVKISNIEDSEKVFQKEVLK